MKIKLAIRYIILVPLGWFFVLPIVSLTLWWNPIEVYKDFWQYLKSGQSLGVFD